MRLQFEGKQDQLLALAKQVKNRLKQARLKKWIMKNYEITGCLFLLDRVSIPA